MKRTTARRRDFNDAFKEPLPAAGSLSRRLAAPFLAEPAAESKGSLHETEGLDKGLYFPS